ncbi:MAG: RluA family pseudouridine synthase [Kiritimatiellae bacterium]|nr:RluA family pseudouridine synthase [Kiritimatiellia bacterium]MDD5521393.1 RluA family pseudouridine synthase [Kiritimatiellia bacterium]
MNNRKFSYNNQRKRPIEILYEDRDIIVADKAPGLLTIATNRGEDKTAYSILTDHVRKGYAKSRNRIFIVHRLDRETSGILIFAKTEQAKFTLQDHWDKTEKKYLAVVYGIMPRKADTITSHLTENQAFYVYSTPDPKAGKLSSTAYEVRNESKNFSLLDVRLLTGRKNQIRVHMADVGHPVVGDTKYGRRNDIYKRLALHAKSISINHPYTNKILLFETQVPDYFDWLMRTN